MLNESTPKKSQPVCGSWKNHIPRMLSASANIQTSESCACLSYQRPNSWQPASRVGKIIKKNISNFSFWKLINTYILLLRKGGKRCLLRNAPTPSPLRPTQSHPWLHYSFIRHLTFLYQHRRCMEKRQDVLYKHVNFISLFKKKAMQRDLTIWSIKCAVIGVCEDSIHCQLN